MKVHYIIEAYNLGVQDGEGGVAEKLRDLEKRNRQLVAELDDMAEKYGSAVRKLETRRAAADETD